MSPETKTAPVQKPGDATVVAGGCVLSVIGAGGAAVGVSPASPGSAGCAVVDAGVIVVVTMLSWVAVAAGVPDEEELPELPEDTAVAAGVTALMLPSRATSKVFVTNCVSLHRGSWIATVLPPAPTRVIRMMARGAGSTADIPSVLGIATFAYPASLSILATTLNPGSRYSQ